MHETIQNMFVLGLPVLEKILRPIIVYLFLIVALRLAGKRELAQLNPFDLVVLLTLSNTVQNAIIGNDNTVTGGLLGASTLLLTNFLVVRFLYNREGLEHLIEGKSDAIIQKGVLREDRLKSEMITHAQLESAAHKQGFGSLDEIEEAILEPGGTLSFVRKTPFPEDQRHRELLIRIDNLCKEIGDLKLQISSKNH